MADLATPDHVNLLRPIALQAVQKAAADLYTKELGSPYTPEEIDADQVPLTVDFVQFVMWLRKHTDFFSGPDLNINFRAIDDPHFAEVLAELALDYTGE